MARPRKSSPAPKDAQSYQPPDSDLPARPEIGAQAPFKKAKPPANYRFDSSLAPALEWDGQNPSRENDFLEELWRVQIAVKVIDSSGNELLVVKELENTGKEQ
jgi:hypothetical protein